MTQVLSRKSLLRKLQLFPRNRQAGHIQTLSRRLLGKATPTATNLKHRLTCRQLCLLNQALILGALCQWQR